MLFSMDSRVGELVTLVLICSGVLCSMDSRVAELVILVLICSGVCYVLWTVGLVSW